jgi:hypothetical protein
LPVTNLRRSEKQSIFEERGTPTCRHEERGTPTCRYEEQGTPTCRHEERGTPTCPDGQCQGRAVPKGCNMTTLKYTETPVQTIRPGAERRLGHTDNLMIVILDFHDGQVPTRPTPLAPPRASLLRRSRGGPFPHGRPANTPGPRRHFPGPLRQDSLHPTTNRTRPPDRLLHTYSRRLFRVVYIADLKSSQTSKVYLSVDRRLK